MRFIPSMCKPAKKGVIQHLIYEVAEEDFALCEFVDVSKNPIQKIIRDGIELLRLG